MWNVILELHGSKEQKTVDIRCIVVSYIKLLILPEILGDIGICSVQTCNLSDILIFIVKT